MPISELYQLYHEYNFSPLLLRKEILVLLAKYQLYLYYDNFHRGWLTLKTYSYDGNKFAQKALDAGCRYAVVDNPMVITNNLYILVDDGSTNIGAISKNSPQNFKNASHRYYRYMW